MKPNKTIPKVARSATIYLFSNVIQYGIPFLLLPVLTRFLTPGDYGIVAIMNVLIMICVILIGLSLPSLIVRNYIAYDKKKIEKHLSNIVYLTIFNFSSIFLFVLILTFFLKSFFDIPRNWFILIPVIAFLQCMIEIILAIWQARQEALKFGTFQIIRSLTVIGLSILFVVVLGMNWQGRILATIIVSGCGALFSLIVLIKKKIISFNISSNISKKETREIYSFGVPLIPHNIGSWVLHSVDRLFINRMVSLAVTGIYSVGYSVGGVISIVQLAFNRAYVPYVFDNLANRDSRETRLKLVRLTYLHNFIILGGAFSLYFLAKLLLPYVVGKSFVGASRYVLWIGLAFAVRGMYQMVAVYLIYAKKTTEIGLTTDFVAAMINIPLNYILIKNHGAIGAAQATFISFLYSYLRCWQISAKEFKMPWFDFVKIINLKR